MSLSEGSQSSSFSRAIPLAALPAACGAVATSLYVATRARHFSADILIYALDIERGDWRAWIDFYHLPLHPRASHGGPTGRLALKRL